MNKSALNKAIIFTFATTFASGCAHMNFDESENTTPEQSAAPFAAQGPQDPNFMRVSNAAPQHMPAVNNNRQMQNTAMQVDCGPNTSENDHYLDDGGRKAEAVKIRSTGYGAPPKAFYPDPQRRLMAMRAAKIDAYRNLAERVAGLQVWGGTTIGDMVVEKDRFRVYLDTHLSGARVITESGHEDGTFETIVELKVDQSFLKMTLPQKRHNQDCSQHTSRSQQLSNASPSNRGMQGNLQNSNFYYQE